MVQFHSYQHGSMNVVSVFCVVASGLLLPHSYENSFLANGRSKHPRLLSEVHTHHAIEVYVLLLCFIYIEAVD
jgi:uncharacterized FAD-dependent dehydrogenase